MMPSVVMFDIDNTLARSKQPIEDSMGAQLRDLLSVTKVGIISGGKLSQFMKQIVERLPEDADLSNLYLLPTSGAALYRYDNGTWVPEYEELLTPEEADHITAALMEAIRETGVIDLEEPSDGERIEFRGSQVSLSALGQESPIEKKGAWDPDMQKRMILIKALTPRLPGYDIKSGGMSTIDITKAGINKAYGVRKLAELLDTTVPRMLYIGDALYPGGNDEVVKETGIPTEAVDGPGDTEVHIARLLKG